jgi:acyl-CoA thioesterase FadM
MNYGNHLGNDVVLSLMHEVRAQFLASFGYTELDAAGVSIIMGDCAIVYKAQGFYGQVLIAECGAADLQRVSFDLHYRFTPEGENKILAQAKTGIVCFDYKTQKVVSLPPALRSNLSTVLPG